MEGKRDGEGIRKGPWKAEEDEVLINHVKRCGPRDWSSIRSKGLLQRTGKSCRLRWVNKLRPNLKNGCKFSLDEERVVIELQAQFGNKWAKIATYLPGRTDNDVKNFWSSRQKRLARILHTSAENTSAKSHKTKREVPVYHDEVPNLEADQRENGKHFFLNEVPKFSCSSEGESTPQASSCSSPCIENSDSFKIRQLPEVVDPKLLGLEVNPVQDEPVLIENSQWSQPQALIPFVENRQPQTDLGFSLETQELMRLDDQYFDMLLPLDGELYCGELPLAMQAPFLEPVVICGNAEGEKIDNTITPLNGGFDDFPAHIYDQVEPQPNPSAHSSSVDVETRD